MLHAQLYFLFVFDFPEMVAPYLKCIFVWGSIKFLFLLLFLFSNKLYLIIIISRFIHISSCVKCQCWYPLILVLSCFRRQASLYQQLNWGTCFTPVNFHFLLYRDGNPNNVNSLGLRDRIPSENVLHSSWKLSFVSRDRPVDGGNTVTCCVMLPQCSRTAGGLCDSDQLWS